MISLDLSKLINSQSSSLPLFPLIPGIFFELCLFAGNPERAIAAVSRLHLDRTEAIVLSLFLSYVIGSALYLWVRLIQEGIKIALSIVLIIWSRFVHSVTTGSRHKWLAKVKLGIGRTRFIQRSFYIQNMGQFRATAKAWRVVARRLFDLYGIDPLDAVGETGAEWKAWEASLARFRPEDYRGERWIVATEAVGWAGLVALRQSPGIRAPYALAFCWFTIMFGLWNDVILARRMTSPEISWAISLCRIVDELKQALKLAHQPATEDEGKAPSNS
jgi:hypothetical protein